MEVTRRQLLNEIEEAEKDLSTFTQARDLVRRRVMEVADSPPRFLPFAEWSGTDAVLGSLDLVCHAIERTISELKETLGSTPVPRLRLVKEDNEQSP